ncbi:TPA: hypothetical protein ACNIM8_005891 [Pseudomonas aeruginosa]
MKKTEKFALLITGVLGMLAVFHRPIIACVGEKWFYLIVFVVVAVGGRLMLYVYRKDRGLRDSLDNQKWWDVWPF